MNIEPTRAERIEVISKQLQLAGWTLRIRNIDKKEDGELLGLRITAAHKLFERALSVQVFDRETVTLSFGFMQEEHVTLTGDDGREFLQWMKTARPEVMSNDLWTLLPEKKTADDREIIGATSMQSGKPALVNYLARSNPEIFGPHGAIAEGDPNWPEFYTAVMKIMEYGIDERHNFGLIHELELIAHRCYKDANQILRSSDAQNIPARTEAHALVRTAEIVRQTAGEIRGRMERPPAPAKFPEEIVSIAAPAAERNFISPAAAAEPVKPAEEPPEANTGVPTVRDQQGVWVPIGARDLIRIDDKSHAWHNRVSQVKEVRPDCLIVEDQGRQEHTLQFDQVVRLGH